MEIDPFKALESALVSDALSILAENGEALLDHLLKDGMAKELPVIGTIIGNIRFASSVNKLITARKLYKFLTQLQKVPLIKRIDQIDKISRSGKYRSSVGLMVWELLDKIESDYKPEIIGKLFAAYLDEKISFEIYLRLAHIVKNAFYPDLAGLVPGKQWRIEAKEISDPLLVSGLIDVDLKEVYVNGKDGIIGDEQHGTLNELGQTLYTYGLS